MNTIWLNRLNSDPISLRLLFWILLLSALFTVITSTIQLYAEYVDDRGNLDSALEQISDTSLPAIGHALWAIDKPQLDTIVQGILDQRDMQQVRVVDYYGNTISSAGLTDSSNSIVKSYPIVVSEMGEALTIGTLTATATLDNIYRNLFNKAIIILSTQGLKTFFMSFCILFLVELLIIRYLKQVAVWARSAESMKLEQPLVIERSMVSRNDAFDSLITSINHMRERLHHELKIRKENEQKIQRFSRIFEESLNEIYQFDVASLKFLHINKAACNNLGYSNDEIIRLTPLDIMPELSHPVLGEYLGRLRRKSEDEIIVFETVNRRKNGSVYDVEVHLQLMRAENGPVCTVFVLDISERKKATELLRFEATHDNLTGLINRREFERRLGRLVKSAHRQGICHSLLYMDLDQFKIVNDTCGHMAGDELLKQITLILSKRVRHRDTLARLGGDEFSLLMEHCSIEDASRVADMILADLNDFDFVWQDNSFHVGASIGIIEISHDTENINELLKQADSACYVAKEKGRNRAHMYQQDDKDIEQRHGEMQWISKITSALSNDQMELHAQEIVAVKGPPQQHYELLIRMRGPEGELIPPGKFLPAAERYDLIRNIDRWVIDNACKILSQVPLFLQQTDSFHINLSGQSVSDEGLQQFIQAQFEKYRIPADRICFEITETAAISNLYAASNLINGLKRHGVRFALDDFGSGLSSFAYLKNLPIDIIKIDGQFVKDIADDPIDRAMVKSINEIGHVMNITTVAEFVENDVIFGMLKEIGVDLAQGYGIGTIRPLQELASLRGNVADINRYR